MVAQTLSLDHLTSPVLFFFFFPFIFISWRLITLQYCSGFCHTLTWISHGVTRIPHPDPPSHLPLHRFPLGLPSAPGPSTCLTHPTWAGGPVLFNTMLHAIWCREPTHWKRSWCWKRLRAGEGANRVWDGRIASLILWTWVWANSGRWSRTGNPGAAVYGVAKSRT